jgi:hypothetical protein
MVESLRGFLAFLRAVDLRIFQEREAGLDVYLSGFTALLPLFLGIAAATVFLLAIFKLIPFRRHSIPILLAVGLLAFLIGLAGAWSGYRSTLLPAEAPKPRVLVEGKGRDPGTRPGGKEAVLALPLVIGGSVLAGSVAGSLFLVLFWGKEAKEGNEPRNGKKKDRK